MLGHQIVAGPTPSLLPTDDIYGLVPGHAHEEPLERPPAGIEGSGPPPQGQEHILCHLLGKSRICQDPPGHPEDVALVRLHDLREGALVPGHESIEKSLVRSGHNRDARPGSVYPLVVAEPTVPELYKRRWPSFIVAASVVAIVSIAVVRLPDPFLATIERNSLLDSSAGGWAYRLLAFFAVLQGFFGGFYVVRIDHVKRSRVEDPKVAAMTRAQVVTALSRNAAGMTLLTLVYGLAAFGVTGQRGGFWLFPLMCLFQGAWYFREIGAVSRWLGFQPDTAIEVVPDAVWRREPPDYTPPIARGLTPIDVALPNKEVAEQTG